MGKLLFATLLAACLMAAGQERPAPQMAVFRDLAEALANRDADAFLEQFDPQTPHFDTLSDEIRELLAVTQEVGSTMDVISDDGDEQKRTLELDWLLKIDNDEPRRQVMHCRIEKQGKKWKITALEPVEFFKK
ncbi:MAG TPA: hypothetical protein VGJ09_17125 [Bryobacteraceae bacterium]|jgi:murein L,D-transpeptidase YcbB/YkuD